MTKEQLESRIVDTAYMVLPDTAITICNLTLENGFNVRGESAGGDPRTFNLQTGREIAYCDALDKLLMLEEYLLAERRWKEATQQ